MFNLTCYSEDGINYTVEQLENYYLDGSDIDITKYVIQDKKNLNRVKTYKKINFDYEKSESVINVGFNSNAGIEYGSLHYSNIPPAEGEEYSIKLPFEDLNFSNLSGLLQVGYSLKTDLQKYIPKPIILYDYNSTALTTVPQFYFNTSSSGGTSTPHTVYKAFGQETLISDETYSLNFNEQQSTLTNEIVPRKNVRVEKLNEIQHEKLKSAQFISDNNTEPTITVKKSDIYKFKCISCDKLVVRYLSRGKPVPRFCSKKCTRWLRDDRKPADTSSHIVTEPSKCIEPKRDGRVIRILRRADRCVSYACLAMELALLYYIIMNKMS